MIKYIVDIDNTICKTTSSDYHNSIPLPNRIKKINDLYEGGSYIIYWTARGSTSGHDWSELTTQQLNQWGCKYHEIRLGKPSYDVWIDDKAINSEEYFDESIADWT